MNDHFYDYVQRLGDQLVLSVQFGNGHEQFSLPFSTVFTHWLMSGADGLTTSQFCSLEAKGDSTVALLDPQLRRLALVFLLGRGLDHKRLINLTRSIGRSADSQPFEWAEFCADSFRQCWPRRFALPLPGDSEELVAARAAFVARYLHALGQ